MAHVNMPAAQPIYDAAARFVDAALRGDDSIFTPGRPIWAAANVEDLYHRFVERPDTSDRSFLEKFRDQLAGMAPGAMLLEQASPEVYQLASELIYVHLLIATGNIGGQAKRGLINMVLNWAPQSISIPPERAAALDMGLARVGTAYLTYRPFQLAFLLRFVRDWKGLPRPERERLLDNPWDFKAMLFQVEISHAYAQREAILHLVHPNTFEAIVSREHKQRFVRDFATFVTEPTDDVDRALLQIRTEVDRRYGAGRSLYTIAEPPPPGNSRLPRSLGPRLRAYVALVARLDGSNYTPAQILERLDTSSQADDLRAVPAPEDLVTDLLKLRLLKPIEVSGHYRRWSHLDDGSEPLMLRYAVLTLLIEDGAGGYELPILGAPMDGASYPERAWPVGRDLIDWYVEAGLVEPAGDGQWRAKSDALAPRGEATATARAINTFLENLQRVRASRSDLPPLSDDTLPVLDPAVLDARIAEIQRELLIDRSTILRIYRALIAGHHIILTGPPGTGKTHLARVLPRILWRDAEPTVLLAMPTDPTVAPTEPPVERHLYR
ncbi:MAG TPA: ATP-binding protein, partial [Roseiflexaceae bacterium]